MGKSNSVCWEETVFEHRNKEYGAYVLRYNYKEAIRLVNSMPDWSPAEENGVKISLEYTLTVPFVLK